METINIPEDNKSLHFLYESFVGRIFLKILCAKWISKLAGIYLDSHLSKWIIPRFAKNNNIDLSLYEDEAYTCFNDFFIRKIRKELRPIEYKKEILIAPCDGLLSAYKIENDLILPVKQSRYSLTDLLQSQELANQYKDGICLVFRLCVNHYHRYCYIDTGNKGKNVHIDGILHTVRPIALRNKPVFSQNSREYTIIESEEFGPILQMEVGAMLVGKICNHHENMLVDRGDEKGYFKYGGSTVIVLIKDGMVELPDELFDATNSSKEVPVLMGQMLGKSITKQ